MALIDCGECGKQFSSQAKACVHCGAGNPGYKKKLGMLPKLILVALVGGALFLLFGAFLLATDPTSDQRISQRDAISYCEDQYQKLKGDPRMSLGALQLAYSACEKMKADYRSKWGREP